MQFKAERLAEAMVWAELVRGWVSSKVLKNLWLLGLLYTPIDLVSIFRIFNSFRKKLV